MSMKEEMDQSNKTKSSAKNTFFVSLVSGGFAGTSTDVALFPIDTIKTRLQSSQGFLKAGGFNGIYRGLGATALGSSPGAALFFSVYESVKPISISLQEKYGLFEGNLAVSHMAAASMGEVAACLVRVPTEVVKSRMQTNAHGSNTIASTIQNIFEEQRVKHSISPSASSSAMRKTVGLIEISGLYRGFRSTIMREIPFALIQFPLYERFKIEWSKSKKETLNSLEAAMCGSVAGGIAAGLTTPLDVIKTRIMLGKDGNGVEYKGIVDVVQRIHEDEGIKTFTKGIQPRVMWISIGGFVFFGAYEFASSNIKKCLSY